MPSAMVWYVPFVKVWHVSLSSILRVPFLVCGIWRVLFTEIQYFVSLSFHHARVHVL